MDEAKLKAKTQRQVSIQPAAKSTPAVETGDQGGKPVVVNVELPRAVWLELRRRCDEEGTSMRAFCREAVRAALGHTK